MAAPEERPLEYRAPDGGTEGTCRLRLRTTPEAVIIVTKQNRIVLVDSSAWSMEEFNRREVIEILLPGGFHSTVPGESQPQPGTSELPVELTVGRLNLLAGTAAGGAKSQVSAPEAKSGIEGALTQGAQDAILVVAPDGKILSCNATATKLYGYSEEELAGNPLALLIPYEHGAAEERLRNKVLGGETVPAFDTARVRKDRNTVPVSAAISLIKDAKGSILGTSEITRDISVRQKVERELAAQVDALTRSNQELQDYAMVVAHDLQAPLNLVAKYFSELSRRCGNLIDSETAEILTTAADAVPRMQRLIRECLELARIDSRGLNRVETDCATVVAQALSNLETPLKESNAKITLDAMPRILADPTQLGQVFQNLVANSLKFRGESTPEIRISAELRAGEWRFSVTDNGIGIEPAMVPRLFLPLQRLHAGGPYAGSGLGLAIVKRILARHGGRVWVESKPGAGSTFYFTIPSAESKGS